MRECVCVRDSKNILIEQMQGRPILSRENLDVFHTESSVPNKAVAVEPLAPHAPLNHFCWPQKRSHAIRFQHERVQLLAPDMNQHAFGQQACDPSVTNHMPHVAIMQCPHELQFSDEHLFAFGVERRKGLGIFHSLRFMQKFVSGFSPHVFLACRRRVELAWLAPGFSEKAVQRCLRRWPLR